MVSYRTLAAPVRAQVEVRRSRFLARVERAGTEDEARAVLARVRAEHPDARHHCSAMLIGPSPALERAHDDGEPAGTAGAPMLEVLRGSGLSDVVAVVTRWFGGTLLGAGGLVRAYSDAVRAALADARPLERRLLVEHAIVVDHARAGRLESALRARGVGMLDTRYGAQVELVVATDPGADLPGLLGELGAPDVQPVPGERRWVDAPAGQTPPEARAHPGGVPPGPGPAGTSRASGSLSEVSSPGL